MHKFTLKHLRQITLSSAIIASTWVSAAHADILPLEPTPEHPTTLADVYSKLSSYHYRRVTVDNAFSMKVLDKYLLALDPNKAIFTKADIDAFAGYQTTLDDALENTDLSPAYDIYNTYLKHYDERLSYLLAQLQKDEPFDFTKDDYLEVDRSESPWPETTAQANDLFFKQAKSAMMGLLNSGKEYQAAREQLVKRFERQQKRLEQTKSEDVFQTYVNVVSAQYDPHTNYYSPRTSENFKIQMSLSLEGIGAVLSSQNDFTEVVRIIPASPAEKTGQLNPTDLIVGVGQEQGEIQDVVGWRLDDVVDLIRGPRGTTVRLEVKTKGSLDQPARIVEIVRNKIKLEDQSAKSKVIEVDHDGKTGRFGVIDIPTFYSDFAAMQRGDKDFRSTTRDVDNLIQGLRSEAIDGLIIDLRNNGGGSLTEAQNLVGLFIERGPVVQIRDQNNSIRILADQNPYISYKGPLAVLVNRSSASASEIFAAAMQDYGRALVVGGTTFGKGTVQSIVPLSNGQIKLTSAKFYRISGASTQHKGVTPDILFPSRFDPEVFGESSAEGALPWDEVIPAGYRHAQLDALIDRLIPPHQTRIEEEPDFAYVLAQRKHFDDLQQVKKLSLNIEKAKQDREANDARQLAIENERRIAKGEEPFETLEDTKGITLEKDENGDPINQVEEAYLAETGKILMDALFPSKS